MLLRRRSGVSARDEEPTVKKRRTSGRMIADGFHAFHSNVFSLLNVKRRIGLSQCKNPCKRCSWNKTSLSNQCRRKCEKSGRICWKSK